MNARWAKLKKRLECPTDEDADYKNTQWCNRDLIPIPPDRRTYHAWSYLGFWTVSGSNISSWSIGSTLLAFGLSPAQAIGIVILGGFLAGCLAIVAGWPGAQHHIGFTVSSRFTWGLRGSYFPVILRTFVGTMWFGIQAYWGGQATRVALGALIPGLAHLPNSFSASSHLETKDFIGFVIWMCAFIPALLIKPERLQVPFVVCFFLFCASCFGILIWSVSTAHGAGPLFHETNTAPNLGWAFMFGITSVLGAWGGGIVGQSDWTRYAKAKHSPTISQLIGTPLTIGVTAIIGIVATSASNKILGGEIIWNPIFLLAAAQEYYHSNSAVRAGVFFAGIGLVASQLSISIVLNSMSVGMDLSGLWPRYINIRRGSYILMILGIATQPWQLLSTATKFLTVLSGFGVVLAPLTGILLADYHIIKRRRLNLNDLYIGDTSSTYWYSYGFNWRPVLVLFMSIWPGLPGLVATANGYTDPKYDVWKHVYNIIFVLGLSISFVLFIAINYLFPAGGLNVDAPFISGHAFDVLDGVDRKKDVEEVIADEKM